MKNISVLIEGSGKKTFKFKKPIVTYGTRIAAKEVAVFWNFKNITSTIGNNTFIIKSKQEVTETINDGYYDFQALKERLKLNKLELQMNTYNNTCTIENKNAVKVD